MTDALRLAGTRRPQWRHWSGVAVVLRSAGRSTMANFRSLQRNAMARRAIEQTLPPRGEPQAAPDLDDILFERPPRLLRGPHYIAAVLFLTILLLTSVLRVDVVVAARGKLAPDGPPMVVQPLDRAVIRDIRVKPGDTVRQGDILASLDPTFAAADNASLAAQQRALQAQMRRLTAELENKPLSVGSGTPDELLQLQLYQQRQALYASRLDRLDAEVARTGSALTTAEEARGPLSRERDIAREIERMRDELFKGSTGSKLNYLEAQARRMRAEHDFQGQLGKIAELEQSLRSAKAERQNFVEAWQRELLEDLAKVRSEYSKVSEELAKAVRVNDLVMLRAPADGVVLDVAKRSVGSVLQPAEPLVTLVPLNTPLIAEVMIASADVGYAELGDGVVVKVDAFPYQRNGSLKGRLRAIAQDSLSSPAGGGSAAPPADGGSYHRSEIRLTSTALHDMPDGTRLIPGMTVTAEIDIGSRSVLSYFLYPLSRALQESFREP